MSAVVWPNGSTSIPIVTSEYGYREHPITGGVRLHAGIDLIGFSTIRAPMAGLVTFAGYNGGAGNEVRLRASNGDVFRLLHNERLYVREGDWVAQSAGVALMGSTGDSTGDHCHFETRPGGGSAIDPREYVARMNGGSPAGGGGGGSNEKEDEEMLVNIQGKVGVRNGGAYYIADGVATFLGASIAGLPMLSFENGTALAKRVKGI